MFTVNFKRKLHPKIKLDMILFQTNYARVSKTLNVSGRYEDWDQTKQCFKSKSQDALSKNKILLDLRLKYQKVADDWDAEGIKWSSVQWSHYFDEKQKDDSTKQKVRVMTLSQ